MIVKTKLRFKIMYISVGVFSLFLMACGAKQNIPEPELTENPWGITLSVENVTPTGLTMVVTQSDVELTETLITGLSYNDLEVFSKDGWVDVVDISGELSGSLGTGVAINENDTQTFNAAWEWKYGSLTSGYYRIGKTISVYGSEESITLYAQFQIE